MSRENDTAAKSVENCMNAYIYRHLLIPLCLIMTMKRFESETKMIYDVAVNDGDVSPRNKKEPLDTKY